MSSNYAVASVHCVLYTPTCTRSALAAAANAQPACNAHDALNVMNDTQ